MDYTDEVLSKTKARKIINSCFRGRMRSHYLKWDIDGDWSIRYFFVYDARPLLTGQYVLKSHVSKIYIPLTSAEAIDYMRYKCHSLYPEELFSVLSREKSRYCRAIVKHADGTVATVSEANAFMSKKQRTSS